MTNLRAWAIDTAERVGFTFAEALLGALVLQPYTGLSSLKAAVSAGVIAAMCYLKTQLALLVPNTVSPASLVPDPTAALPAPPEPNTLASSLPAGLSPEAGKYGTMQVGGVLITILPSQSPGGSA